MKRIKNILASLSLIALCLSSCELTKELDGKYQLKKNEGLLNLDLVPKTPLTRAGEDAMDVNTFKVDIVEMSTGAVARSFDSYEKLKASLPIILPIGKYKVEARNGELQAASRTPYFAGNAPVEIKEGIESKAEVVCKMATTKVTLSFSDDFLESFKDDYSIGVTNGDGGVMYFTKDEWSAVYLSIPEGSASIQILAKVTDAKTNKDLETNYTVTKPGGEELQGGDSFNVNVKPTEEDPDPEVPGEPTKPSIGLKLDIDLTLDETGITIKVPTELIEENVPENPDGEGAPEIIGADHVIEVDSDSPPTVQVTMNVPAGIKNLFVTIASENEDFESLISQMGLGETFDLANPGELEEMLGGSIEDGSGLGLIDPADPIKNKKKFVFDLSGFMSLLQPFGTVSHFFTLRLVDNNDQEVTKTLTVKVVN